MSSCRCSCSVSPGGNTETGPFTYTVENVNLQSGGPQDGTKTTISINNNGERVTTTTDIIIDAGPSVSGRGFVLPTRPYLTVPVSNTAVFPAGSLDANNEIGFIEYCQVLEAKANALANNLQSLYDTQIAAVVGGGGGGGGVSEGVGNSCDEPFEIKADGFTINCNSMTVDACDGGKPAVTFNCSSISFVSGGVTVTITGGDVTISGGTLDLPAGTTVNGSAITTLNHTHTSGTLAADINTGAISGSTGTGS